MSAWREHIPFAMFLIDILKPRTFVELGTHWGNSYCAFCQAIDELGLETRAYAVDTWNGDEHSGTYGPEVLADLRAHHDPLYGSFSRLVEGTFDDALTHFPDGSVDLLHIDGLHTYDAVRHDYDAWRPKLSRSGVVVLHDINARERDFGVWKLWEEIKGAHPHLELLHAHGLGVLALGEDQPAAFRELLDAPPERLEPLRELFFALGRRLRLQLQVDDMRSERAELEHTVRRRREELAELQERKEHAIKAADELRAELAERERELAHLRTSRYKAALRYLRTRVGL